LLRDGFGAEKYFHVLLAELKDPPPPSKQEGIYLTTVPPGAYELPRREGALN